MTDRHARHRRSLSDRHRRPVDGFRASSPDRFERIVTDAVGSLPPRLSAHLDGVEVAIEDIPPATLHDADGAVPLCRYDVAPPAAQAPAGHGRLRDRLVLYRRPLEARAMSHRDLGDLVRQTVSMQIARQVGIDDDPGDPGAPGWD